MRRRPVTTEAMKSEFEFTALACPSDTQCHCFMKVMKVMEVFTEYQKMGLTMATCDKCNDTLEGHDIVLHCPPNSKHYQGYDLCHSCAHLLLQKQQQKNTHTHTTQPIQTHTTNTLSKTIKKKKKSKKSTISHTHETVKSNETNVNAFPQMTQQMGKRKRGRPPNKTHTSSDTNHNNHHQSNVENLQRTTSASNVNYSSVPMIGGGAASVASSSNASSHSYNNNFANNGTNISMNTVSNNSNRKRKRCDNSGASSSAPLAKRSKSGCNNPTFQDWRNQILTPAFIDNFAAYLGNCGHLPDTAINYLNSHSSWMDFDRVNNGQELVVLNLLLSFDDVVLAKSASQSVSYQKNLHHYTTSRNIDWEHIWEKTANTESEQKEHCLITQYASNYIAHNSIHSELFGGDVNTTHSMEIEWKRISFMIEQSHFLRDWKLNQIDKMIQKQIDILQSLIVQYGRYSCTFTHKISIWKNHVIILRGIRRFHQIGLEIPMNILQYNRTEVDHVAKISAINGIEYLLREQMSPNKIALPPSDHVPSTLRLRDLLPSYKRSSTNTRTNTRKNTQNSAINLSLQLPRFDIGNCKQTNETNETTETNNDSRDSDTTVETVIDTHKVIQVYADKKYWDQFHNDQKFSHFEWFCNFDDIKQVIIPRISDKNCKILEIGCGISSLAAKMVLLGGYTDITCLDWCESAISKIRDIHRKMYSAEVYRKLEECITYSVQDLRSMQFKKRSFSVVIDKGTLDAIDCGVSNAHSNAHNSNAKLDNFSDNFDQVVAVGCAVHRILKKDGMFIVVTSRSIAKRIEFVEEMRMNHKRCFIKKYAKTVQTELKDWRDGDKRTPKLIILSAVKKVKK